MHRYRAPKHIRQWSADNPETVKAVTTLYEAGIDAAIYGGTAAEIGMYYANRKPIFPLRHVLAPDDNPGLAHDADDIDLLVAHKDFPQTVDTLNADVVQEHRSVKTFDGYQLEYNLLVAERKVGRRVIEICHPAGPVYAEDPNGDQEEYNLEINDYVADRFTNYTLPDGEITLAHPLETAVTYGLLRGNESDMMKSLLIIMATSSRILKTAPLDEYLDHRVKQTGDTNVRIYKFVGYALGVFVRETLANNPLLSCEPKTLTKLERAFNNMMRIRGFTMDHGLSVDEVEWTNEDKTELRVSLNLSSDRQDAQPYGESL